MGYGGGGNGGGDRYYQQQEEPRHRQDYQPEFRQDYRPEFSQQQQPQDRYEQEQELAQDPRYVGQPRRVGLPNRGGPRPSDTSSIPSTPDYVSGGGGYSRGYGPGSESPHEEAPRDFNPNAMTSFDAGQQRYAEYAAPPQQRGQRSQYTPVDPVRTRQRSLSGGKSRPDQRDVERANAMDAAGYQGGESRGRSVYPDEEQRRPSGGASRGAPVNRPDEYQYSEKASTVNLVDGVEDYEMGRRGSAPRKPTKARGGPTIKRGDVPMEDMGEFFTEVRPLDF